MESIEKEVKRSAYETMIDCLKSYQVQGKKAIEEFQHGICAFYRANDKLVLCQENGHVKQRKITELCSCFSLIIVICCLNSHGDRVVFTFV
ncbi:hypothetical protein [Parageobacillus toebii]|uniref:Uncharacterized protein n=1 Tax=Parageobacillus toebii NBRC 107807 TaxID=1223503 RepID=A0AA89T5A3_9BACL|nr:hypothetical protein [Parageobacillus toebii NBRC 107807]